MNPQHLAEFVIGPVLDNLDLDGRNARVLLLGTAMVESDLRHLRQLSDGPALGLWQMEPDTHDSVWNDFLFYRLEMARTVERMSSAWPRGAFAMVGNLNYACAMARILYRWRSARVPASPEAMANLWKLRYNTNLGAGTVERAIPHFRSAFDIIKED
jgi:hypothetical protein